MRIVCRKAGLRRAHDDQVRETVHQHAVQAAIAVSPMLRQLAPVTPADIVTGPPRVFGTHFKPRRIDQAVDLIGLAIGDDRILRDPLDAPALCIDQRDIVPVEGRQVAVMETGPLAELAIPRLQRFGGGLVLDDLVNAGPHLFHLLEIGNLGQFGQVFRAEVLVAFLRGDKQQVTDDMRPAIHHQVLRRKTARDQRVEILHPVLVPPGLQAFRPVRIGRLVVAHVDGRRRPLEHIEMLGALGDMRHALHRRRARPDNPDALALQAGQAA